MPLSIAAIIEVTRALGMYEERSVTLRRALAGEAENEVLRRELTRYDRVAQSLRDLLAEELKGGMR